MRTLIICAIVFLVAFFLMRKPVEAPNIALAMNEAEDTTSCEGADRCVTVYVAPWCSVCKRAMPTIEKIREFISDQDGVGFQIIVGKDEAAAIDSMAKLYSAGVYLDYQDEFAGAMRISSVPTWIVWDRERIIVSRISGVPMGLSGDAQIRMFLEQNLALGGYLL